EPQREDAVHRDRAVERQRAERVAPHGEEPSPTRFHRVERDQSEGVIEEVEDDVGEEDERRDEANAADEHGTHQPLGAAPCGRSYSSMIIVLSSSMTLPRSVRPSSLISSRTRAGRAESITRVVPTATASSMACVTKRIVRPVSRQMRRTSFCMM